MIKSIYTAIFLFLIIQISMAQAIPNAGFENWTSMGSYSNPDSWGNLNATTATMSVYCCEKGTPGVTGTSFLKLTSKTAGTSVEPGIAVCGMLDPITMLPKSGFTFTGRPTSLTGKWQHMIYGTSQGYIDIKLTRWDATAKTRVSVGSGHVNLSGMAMSWANFSIPVTYTDSNAPDSCIIVLAASGTAPTNLDYLWVDDLKFLPAVGISNNKIETQINIFPNPVSTKLNIDLTELRNQKVFIEVTDINGKSVKKPMEVIATSSTILDISELSKGNYILNVIAKEGILSRNFIKQ